MLKEFYKNNPGTKLNGKRYCAKDDDTLNNLQKKHQRGEIDLYTTIECYIEDWKTIFSKYGMYISSYPIDGTKERKDLPPISIQWQQSYRRTVQKEKRDV